MQPNAFQPPSVWPKMTTLCTSVTPAWWSIVMREVVRLSKRCGSAQRSPKWWSRRILFDFFMRPEHSLSCKLSNCQCFYCLTATHLDSCHSSQWGSGGVATGHHGGQPGVGGGVFPTLESTFAEKSAAVKPERIHAAARRGAAWESANSLWVDFWAPPAGRVVVCIRARISTPRICSQLAVARQHSGTSNICIRLQVLPPNPHSAQPLFSCAATTSCLPPLVRGGCKHHSPSKSPEEEHYKTECVGRINTARTFSLVFVRSRVPHFPFFEFFNSYDGFENCCMDFFSSFFFFNVWVHEEYMYALKLIFRGFYLSIYLSFFMTQRTAMVDIINLGSMLIHRHGF